MPWKPRYNGKKYFYRAVRVGNRVHQEYGGGGSAGQMVAGACAAARAEIQAQCARDRAEQAKLQQTDSFLVRFEAVIKLLVKAQMMASTSLKVPPGENE